MNHSHAWIVIKKCNGREHMVEDVKSFDDVFADRVTGDYPAKFLWRVFGEWIKQYPHHHYAIIDCTVDDIPTLYRVTYGSV
jgi:hypothetical protein